MIELQLGTSTVSGGAPYLIHHVERVPSLVETALDVQVGSSIFSDDAADLFLIYFISRTVFFFLLFL